MTAPGDAPSANRTGFRAKLLVTMMLVTSAITALGLYVEHRNLAAEVARGLRGEFKAELESLHNAQEVRHAALAERCRALVRRPRIHAALEDNALDLLYPSAKDELRDVMAEDPSIPESAAHALRARFYRFLGPRGEVISPPNADDVGALSPEEESRLALQAVPGAQQLGYLVTGAGGPSETVAEVIAMPIVSTETSEAIAALVVGFKPVELRGKRPGLAIKRGIWMNECLQAAALAEPERVRVGIELTRAAAAPGGREGSVALPVDGVPHLLFWTRLNPDSLYPAAYEVCLFSLADLQARQRHAFWQILGAGALMLCVGLAASHYFSGRLSVPVERLAVNSEIHRAQRERAETALEQTSVELEQSVRFAANASHQLKTPVTVLRAGLEELLARENVAPEVREEISDLVHQTYRLTGVIEDLLLLSRMDAGRLRLDLAPVDLAHLLEGALDDLGAQPNPFDLAIEREFPAALQILGEKRYTILIVQNVLENARKYNRPGGRIRVRTTAENHWVLLTIGNTGRPIPPGAQEHLFERFHRGSTGSGVPGHGLGLSLARELARLHGGELRLTRSDDSWTEFEARFRQADPTSDRP